MPKVIKATEVKYNPRAVCSDEDCPWERQPSRHTTGDAKAHVRQRGHEVVIIHETRQLWRREP